MSLASLDSRPARTGFWGDVSSAARALVTQPTVALVVVFLWCLPVLLTSEMFDRQYLKTVRSVAQIAVLLFFPGWFGAERIFFLRHLQGKPVTLRHLLGLVKAFTGRFLVLGLVVVLALLLPSLFLGFVLAFPIKSTRFHAGSMLSLALIDFALTFVPPALAFSTRSVRRALRIGLRMIRENWPRSALYVLFPPLALNMNILAYPTTLPMLRLVGAGCLAIVALLAKGAIVAFYLRERGLPGDDGAAYLKWDE